MSLSCTKPKCPEHNHCAYHGDEAGRCPWCHVEWSSLIVRGSHTCEQAKTWPQQERQWRVRTAASALRSAAQQPKKVDVTGHCSHVESEPL